MCKGVSIQRTSVISLLIADVSEQEVFISSTPCSSDWIHLIVLFPIRVIYLSYASIIMSCTGDVLPHRQRRDGYLLLQTRYIIILSYFSLLYNMGNTFISY